jgi:hypothetical protein
MKQLMLRYSVKVSYTKHVHPVHADKVFMCHTSIKKITSYVKMMWCEEKCVPAFGGETLKKPLGSLM